MNRTLEDHLNEQARALCNALGLCWSDHHDAILRHLTDLSRDYSQRIQELERQCERYRKETHNWSRAEKATKLLHEERERQLRAENEALLKQVGIEHASYQKALAENEALRKDKERLDWLEALAFMNRESEMELRFDYKGTLREAIDGTARQLDSKKGEK